MFVLLSEDVTVLGHLVCPEVRVVVSVNTTSAVDHIKSWSLKSDGLIN